jgi:hypothetical protein
LISFLYGLAYRSRAPIRGWNVDDAGIPKKGKHSVDVVRKYCGELGKQDNCQVAAMLSVANDHAPPDRLPALPARALGPMTGSGKGKLPFSKASRSRPSR